MQKKLCILLLLVSCSVFAQENRFILSNGMEVFISRHTSPIVQVELCVRDGYYAEEKETAGFIDINRRLFWTNREGTLNTIQELGIANTTSTLTSHASIFSSFFPASRSEEVFALLKELASTYIFDDKQLDAVLNEYRMEQKEFTDSVYGIIHSLVIEHLYPDAPWNQTQQMAYCYYQDVKREKMRSILTSIRQRYYQPDNMAIFITSPFSEEQVLDLVKKNFESWQGKSLKKTAAETVITGQQQKTVFISDGLPQGLEQFIVVFPLPSSEKKDSLDTSASTLSFILNNENSALKQALMHNKKLGLERQDYADISFEWHFDQSRLIVQALLQKTGMSLEEKSGILVSSLVDTSFSDEILRNSYLYKQSFYNGTMTIDNTVHIESWAMQKQTALSFPSEKDVQDITAQEPYIFLLLNSKEYDAEKKNLTKNKWNIVFEKDLRQKITQRKLTQTKENQIEPFDSSINEVSLLLQQHSGSIVEGTTKNGMRVSIDPGLSSGKTIIQLTIDGGIIFTHAQKPLIEHAVIQYVENEMRYSLYDSRLEGLISDNFYIESNTGLHKSTISVTCSIKDSQAVLFSMGRALAYLEITPAQADELILELASTKKMARFDVNSQLYNAAIETIYAGTPYESSIVEPFLDPLSYNYTEIQKAVTQLYNSHRYSFAISTDAQTAASLNDAVETYFSFIKDLGSITSPSIEPMYPAMTRWKTLYRIFTTSLSAEEAGERPLKLIPTTNFQDPSHLYIRRPVTDAAALFDVALIALAQYLEDESKKFTIPPFESADVYFDDNIPALCGIRFTKVTSYTAVQNLVDEAIQNFDTILSDETNTDSQTRIEKAKGSWVTQRAGKTQGFKADIAQYIKLESSTQKDIVSVYTAWIQKQTLLWILSSDTSY